MTTESDRAGRLAQLVENVLQRIEGGYCGSIGSLNNTYMPQIGVEEGKRWRAELAAALGRPPQLPAVENAHVPLTEAELDELDRRLVADEPQIRTMTRTWAAIAIRQLREAAALVRPPQEGQEEIQKDDEAARVGPLTAGDDGQDLPRRGPRGEVTAAERMEQDAVYQIIRCPKCAEEQADLDGFGFLYCHACGYCTHPSIDGDECNLCGMKITPAPPEAR